MPNVLLIQTDDHAQWASHCYGNTELHTPSLDYLCSTGVRMRNAFTPSPVCSPARASLWTGRIPSQHGLHNALAEHDPKVTGVEWLKGERTLANIFKGAGYATGLSGKWHVGKPDYQPHQDFDYWFSQSLPLYRPDVFVSPWTKPSPDRNATYNHHAIADHAVDFLRVRDDDKPFFLYVGFIATHSPWNRHAERLVEHYRRATFRDIPDDGTYPFGRLIGESLQPTRADPHETRAQYYASVTEIDEQVGRILDELHAQGLTSDTLVVYTSDHGLNMGQHGVWGKGIATNPYNMLEESIRIPMILSHPGAFLGGLVRDEMVTHVDLFQTILEHAGLAPDASERARRNYPGRSFRDLARGDARGAWPEEVHAELGNTRMVRTRDHKLVMRYPDGPNELFDLVRDPRETRSFYADPAYQEIVRDLSSRIAKYFSRYEDPAKSGLRVRELPAHGMDVWTWDGPHERLVVRTDWLDAIEAEWRKADRKDG